MDEPKKTVPILAPRDHFWVSSKDAKGDSARVNFRLMPSMVRQIEIATGPGNDFGWQTPSDFHRWATKKALDIVAEVMNNPFLSNLNQQTNAINQILDDERRLQEQTTAMDKAEGVIREYRLRQDHEGVKITLKNLERGINQMNDRRVRERWQKQFEERFGHLLRIEADDH